MEAAAFALACRLFGSVTMTQGRANKWRGGASGLLVASAENLHLDFANEILQDSINYWECHVNTKWGSRRVFKIIHHNYHFYLVSKVYNSSYNVFYFFLLVSAKFWVSSNSYFLHSTNFAIYLLIQWQNYYCQSLLILYIGCFYFLYISSKYCHFFFSFYFS